MVTAPLSPPPRRIVLTGGPGGGKTAVLEVARRHFGDHLVVLPEAATIVFGGGFPRGAGEAAQRAAQRAIFRVQVELEAMALEEARARAVLCDRGTVDGVAYWPGSAASFWESVGTTQEEQLSHYATVIHLRTPPVENGYNHVNRVRVESAEEAARIDERIAVAWSRHPRRFFIESEKSFIAKAARALELILAETPVPSAVAGGPPAP